MTGERCRREKYRLLYEVIFMLKELYEKRGIGITDMAQMTRVGERTLHKFDRGEKIRDESKRRIEIMLDVIEEHNVLFPAAREFWWGHIDWSSSRFRTVEKLKTECHEWARKKDGWVEPNRK